MALLHDTSHRGWSQGSTHGATTLQEKFEMMKEIGDGSFGSVALARVRGGGSHVAKRGTLVSVTRLCSIRVFTNLVSFLRLQSKR